MVESPPKSAVIDFTEKNVCSLIDWGRKRLLFRTKHWLIFLFGVKFLYYFLERKIFLKSGWSCCYSSCGPQLNYRVSCKKCRLPMHMQWTPVPMRWGCIASSSPPPSPVGIVHTLVDFCWLQGVGITWPNYGQSSHMSGKIPGLQEFIPAILLISVCMFSMT